MGKLKRPRQKLHASAKTNQPNINTTNESESQMPIVIKPVDNLFAGIDINIDSLSKKLNDDVLSVKSLKSIKSDKSQGKAITKKEKLKLRKEMLMQKIDTVNQLKKEAKRRKKRKSNAIIGDTNPLHDALPSLESLLKAKSDNDKRIAKQAKPKAVQKSSRRKKKLLHDVGIYKKLLKNKDFNKNSLTFVTDHIKQFVKYNSKK